MFSVEGDRGAGDREKRGWEVYRRQEAGSQGGGKQEKKGKITQHFAILICTIKKMQRGGSQQIQGGNWDKPRVPTPPAPPIVGVLQLDALLLFILLLLVETSEIFSFCYRQHSSWTTDFSD